MWRLHAGVSSGCATKYLIPRTIISIPLRAPRRRCSRRGRALLLKEPPSGGTATSEWNTGGVCLSAPESWRRSILPARFECGVDLQFGWYRLDARGNRSDLSAEFAPPAEHLPFGGPAAGECTFAGIWAEPIGVVLRPCRLIDAETPCSTIFPTLRSIRSRRYRSHGGTRLPSQPLQPTSGGTIGDVNTEVAARAAERQIRSASPATSPARRASLPVFRRPRAGGRMSPA